MSTRLLCPGSRILDRVGYSIHLPDHPATTTPCPRPLLAFHALHVFANPSTHERETVSAVRHSIRTLLERERKPRRRQPATEPDPRFARLAHCAADDPGLFGCCHPLPPRQRVDKLPPPWNLAATSDKYRAVARRLDICVAPYRARGSQTGECLSAAFRPSTATPNDAMFRILKGSGIVCLPHRFGAARSAATALPSMVMRC